MLIVNLLLALIPTIVIELGVLWLLRERRRLVLWASVVVNVLTNVPLNLFVHLVANSWTIIAVGELLVFGGEALWYYLFTKEVRRAVVYSFLCNAVSFLTGVLAQLIVIYLL